MIITCPHCQTKYQVTYEAIGSAGRKVQCAHCNQAWQQEPLAPEVPAIIDPITEDALDEAMASEEEALGAERDDPAPPPAETAEAPRPGRSKPADAAEIKKRQKAFTRRQSAMASRLPFARTRRAARALGLVTLTGIIVGGYLGRFEIVLRYPDLAGLYEAVGLGVNVVGLEFDELATLEALDQGNSVLDVSAQIVGLRSKPAHVPPVVVSLLDAQGKAVYEWSVAPKVRDLMAGERATFDTRLSLPPSDATHVRLSFVGYGSTPLAQGETVPAADVHASEGDGHGQPAEPHAPAADAHGDAPGAHAAPTAEAHAAPTAEAHAAPAADAHAAPAEAGHGDGATHAPAAEDHAGEASPTEPTHH